MASLTRSVRPPKFWLGFDGGLGGSVIHFDKTEAAGAAGFAVIDKLHGMHVAVFGKEVTHLLFGGRPGKIPHIDGLGHEKTPSQKNSLTALSPIIPIIGTRPLI